MVMPVLDSNTTTSSTQCVRVPRGMNPVRIGRDPRCTVRLNSHFVPPEAGAIANVGDGWQFWALVGGICRVGDRLLDKNDHRPIESGQHLGVGPFNLRMVLDTDNSTSPIERRQSKKGPAAQINRQ